MVSENIAALRAHFLKYADKGMVLAPTAVQKVADLLLTMALDASALEGACISPVAMAPENLPDNVVPMRHRGGAA